MVAFYCGLTPLSAEGVGDAPAVVLRFDRTGVVAAAFREAEPGASAPVPGIAGVWLHVLRVTN